jgi:hypothetical protein
MVTARDFVRAGGAVALTAGGRKAFFRAYEMRMDTLVTHPMFEYRVSYRLSLCKLSGVDICTLFGVLFEDGPTGGAYGRGQETRF